MPLIHFTNRHMVQFLATETRKSDMTPHAQGQAQVAFGRYLAAELVEHLDIETCDIQHPQGIRQGWKIAQEQEIALLVMMRSGLYVADGIREVFREAPMFHVHTTRKEGLNKSDLAGLKKQRCKTCIIIDSVVNTGASLEPILRQLTDRGLRIIVLSLVSPTPTANRLTNDWPDVYFFFGRTSENQYVGKGTTDTGNRLFGTSRIDDDSEEGKRHIQKRVGGKQNVIPIFTNVA